MMHVDEIAARAQTAIRAGDLAWGRELLGFVLLREPGHERAWLWMSAVVDGAPEQRYCLRRVLAANAENPRALAGLELLGPGEALPPTQLAVERQTLRMLRPVIRPGPQIQAQRLVIPHPELEPDAEPALIGGPALRSLVIVLLLSMALAALLRVPELVALSL